MFKNIIWEYIGKFGNYLVTFLISIVLTRLLQPEEFGIMALVMVVVSLAAIFMELGFNRAIIQQQHISPLQLSTVFYINAVAAFILMLICFFIAGPLADFYDQPLIKPVFRVISISFLISGLNLVPSSLIYKQLKLKANSIILILASVLSGIIGIVMAYNNYGIWALVAQSLISSALILLLNVWYVRWWPTREFDFASIKPLWHYGSRIFASGILDRIYSRLDSFIIGKIYHTDTLGYYYRAQSMEGFVRTFSAGSIMSSLFPYIAKHQDNPVYLKEIYNRYLNVITFVSAGLCGVLFLLSKDLFIILFTERWNEAAVLFQLMMLAGIVWPVSSLMVNMISGVGNSKSFLRLEVYKKLVMLPAYLFGFLLGLKGFIITYVVASYICLLLNMLFVSRDIKVNFMWQVKIMIPYILLGIIAAAITWGIVHFIDPERHFLRATIIAILFSLLYITGAYILKLKGIELLNKMLEKLRSFLTKG